MGSYVALNVPTSNVHNETGAENMAIYGDPATPEQIERFRKHFGEPVPSRGDACSFCGMAHKTVDGPVASICLDCAQNAVMVLMPPNTCKMCGAPIASAELCARCAEGNDPFVTCDNAGRDKR